jgi:SAM-dependent methyltransferase
VSRAGRALEALAPYIERARSLSGWTFPGLVARHLDAGPPWDYESAARGRAAGVRAALDMGTGGGEVLARVAADLPTRFVATEEWVRNAPVANRLLAPLGIDVVRTQSLSLPFRDSAFDLVLNRHEELEPSEVARVLSRSGTVLTQQVGPDNWPELDQFFPRRHDFGDLFAQYRDGFETAGLTLVSALQHRERVAFGSLGDVVYMLLVAPWDIPGFDPEADIEALLALEDACGTADGVVLTESRFLIEARKPS